jgi:hypothetical protein
MSPELIKLSHKAYAGEPISQAEIEWVGPLLSSSDLEEVATGSGILFLSGDQAEQKRALEALKQVCARLSSQSERNADTALISIIEYVPQRELDAFPRFKEFAYIAARRPFRPTRGSAMRVLRRLAKMGDTRALAILQDAAANDADQTIRSAATTALRLASASE